MKRFKDLSIIKKLVIIFVATAIVLTSIAGYFVVQLSARYIISQIQKRYSHDASDAMDAIDMVMMQNYHNIRSFAQNKILTDSASAPEEITDYLKNKKAIYGFATLSYFNMDRVRIADTEGVDIGKQHDMTRYWEDVLKGDVSAGSDIRIAKDLKIPIIYFASSVKNKEGKPIGVVVARYNPQDIFRIIKRIKEESTHVTLFDKDRNIIVSNCPVLAELAIKGKIPQVTSVQNALSGKNGVILENVPWHKRESFNAYAHERGSGDFKGNDWSLLISVDKNAAFVPIRQLRYIIMLILIIVILIVFLSGPLIASTISTPILKLNLITKKITKGDLSQKVEVVSGDEIGQLADSFNRMTEAISKVKEDLVSEKAYSERIISSIADSLVVVNPDGRIRFVNKAALDLLGYKEDELIGQPLEKIFLQEAGKKEELRIYFQKIIELGAVYNVGLDFLTKQGKAVPVNFSSAVIRDGDKVTGLVGIARDMRQIMAVISDLEKAKTGLEERGKNAILMQRAMLHIMGDLRKAVSAKTEFTGMVSHELRTPLAAIKEGVSVVLDKVVGDINEDQIKYLSIVKHNVDRLGRLINGILDFQKLESGKMEFKMKENNINEVVKEVYEEMLSLAQKKGLDFVLQLDEGLPNVKFDRDGIVQVLTNLVSNAFKFTEKGSVTVITNKGDNYIQAVVKDTGFGLKEEDLPRMFQQFTQIQRKVGGAGLGLSICKAIIKAHGGKIWVESEIGKGTAFYFNIPIEERRT